MNSLQDTRPAPQDGSRSSHDNALSPSAFADNISYAFQLATAQGPLCHEPVQGIAVFLEAVTIESQSGDEISARETLGRLTGEVIKTVRDSIRQGFLDWSPRLLLAMYSCEIQASGELQISSSCLRSHPLDFSFLPFSLAPTQEIGH
jgi:ribosome assembly protein 1